MAELIENGYIKGAFKVKTIGKEYGIKTTANTRITIKGLEFLEENSGMKKVQQMAGKAIETAISMLPTFMGL